MEKCKYVFVRLPLTIFHPAMTESDDLSVMVLVSSLGARLLTMIQGRIETPLGKNKLAHGCLEVIHTKVDRKM